MYNKGIASLPLGNCHVENWADSGVADNNSQQTDDTSTDIDIDTDDKHQVSYPGADLFETGCGNSHTSPAQCFFLFIFL
jgi:hypothetical protein